MPEVERITPYGTSDSKAEQVELMFNSIAPAYDLMNRAMTLGIDRLWRRRAVKLLARHSPSVILDLATGTGDLALRMAREMPNARIHGYDLSAGMVNECRRKVAASPYGDRIDLTVADCLELPVADATADAVTIAFGIRNYADIAAGLREMHRVMRPGAQLCIIELSTPTSPLVKPLYRLYTRGIIPLVGRMVSRDPRAYTYLPESIAAVPQGTHMCSMIEKAGFSDAAARPLTFGVCSIYTAVKPK